MRAVEALADFLVRELKPLQVAARPELPDH
jgi:hypothetical protein